MAGFMRQAGGILCAIAVAVLLAIGSGSAVAKDVALTHDNVSRFLASFSEMRALALSEGVRTGMDAQASKDPIGVLVKAIKSSKLQTKAQDVSVKHGFADLKEWSDTGRSIGQAYLYITVGPAQGIARETLDKNKDNAVKQLEKLGILNDKQKAQFKESLDDLSEQLAREPQPQNVAVVQEMKSDIEAAIKSGLD